MNIPRRIRHNNLEFTHNRKIECSHITVYPLTLGDYHLEHSFCFLVDFFLLLDIVYMFAVGVVTGVEMWAVSH